MTTEEALLQLGNSTADAVLRVLSSLAPDAADKGSVAVIPGGASPLQAVPLPAVATNVSYVDGVTGGNVFVITRLGARRLAATMMMQEPPTDDHDGELDELELSAVGEAMNQMMAAAAGATGHVLGQEVEISVPTTRFLEKAAHALRVAVRSENSEQYDVFAASVNDRPPSTPRDLLEFVPAGPTVPLEEVEPASEICKPVMRSASSRMTISSRSFATVSW